MGVLRGTSKISRLYGLSLLGGLYGSTEPPETVTGDSGGRLVIRSGSGHELRLDDTGSAVALAHHRGSELRFGATAARLHTATDLVIEAPGHTIRLRAAAIEFEEAP